MKHLSTVAIGVSVAVVAAAAIAQTKPPETPATSTNSRKQSGTVGASPDAAPVANPQASQVEAAEPSALVPSPAPSATVLPAPAEQRTAPAERRRSQAPAVAPAEPATTDAGGDEHHPAPRLAKRPDRN